jgi:cell division protease FtsH
MAPKETPRPTLKEYARRLREGSATPRGRFNWAFWLVALIAVILLQLWVNAGQVARISYTDFLALVDEGAVERVEVSDSTVRGVIRGADGAEVVLPPDPVPGGAAGEAVSYADGQAFATTRVDPEIVALLAERGVEVEGVIESNVLPMILSWVVPVLLFVGLWFFLIRRFAARAGGMGGGLMQIGKSKAKVYVETDTGVSFEDVAGVDEAKAELEEVVDFLRDPGRYGRLGGRMPKGVLLVGPPGTGKTLLAKAVAGEAGVPFLSISGSEFVEMFVGVGAARVRDLFAQAREKAPAIIFIDELDALGRARGAGGAMGGHDEKEQTLNQLLVELDGFDTGETGLVLLGATNRPEVLDPALLRAGRFDRQVLVDRPDRPGRVQILRVHMRKVTLAPDVDAAKVAALTPGMTGADLANLVNEAALLATRRGAEAVAMEDFSNAVERIVAGLEKRNRLINERERRVVAFHEMGHALAALSLPGVDPVHKVSIIPRGIGALGYTIQRPTEDRFLMTAEELGNKMVVLLGGRAAERIVFGHLSTGASDDLQKVTDIARSMVARYGMSERLGHVAYERPQGGFLGPQEAARANGPATQEAIDAEVRRLVEEAMERTLGLLTARRAWLDRTAEALLERETLDEGEIAAMTADMPREPARHMLTDSHGDAGKAAAE